MKRRFTLIEVVVSIAILALALTGMLQLLSQSELRIAAAEKELSQFRLYDYVVVNDDLNTAARQLEALLVSFKLRTALIPEGRTPWKKP